jgi:ribosomal protein S12 methylthiotransferase accessory factor YcaO
MPSHGVLQGTAGSYRIMIMIRTWDRQLQKLLDSLENQFEVHELDLPDSPVFIAVAIPANPSITGLKPRLPAGRGLSAAQAMLSAAAESVELLACLAGNFDQHQNQIHITDGFTEIEMLNVATGKFAQISAQRVYLDWSPVFDEPFVHDADTNGCASGSTFTEAFDRALLEIIERDAMALWWFGRQRRKHLLPTCLDRLAPRLSWWLTKRQKQFLLIDITSEFGIPVVSAVSYDENGRNIAMGSAAALDVEHAAVWAATEMIQMEVSMTMGEPNDELRNWFAHASIHEMQQFQPCASALETAPCPHDVQRHLINSGHLIFAKDLTRQSDLLSTARLIVPTLSAFHRPPNIERIVSQSLNHPQFGGIKTAPEIEPVQPY